MKVIIVGGVAGGATAAARIRRLNEHAEITVFERSGWEGTDHGIPDPAGCSFKRTEVPLVYQQRLRKRHIKRQPGRNVWENKGWHGLRNRRDLKGRDRMDVYRKSLYRSPWSFQS